MHWTYDQQFFLPLISSVPFFYHLFRCKKKLLTRILTFTLILPYKFRQDICSDVENHNALSNNFKCQSFLFINVKAVLKMSISKIKQNQISKRYDLIFSLKGTIQFLFCNTKISKLFIFYHQKRSLKLQIMEWMKLKILPNLKKAPESQSFSTFKGISLNEDM